MLLPIRAALAAAALLLTHHAPAHAAEPQTVAEVDLGRYAGTWHEIARLPHFFQRECVGEVTANYTPRPDGAVDVKNRCRRADGSFIEAQGRAVVIDPQSRAKLAVSFLPDWMQWLPVGRGDYWVIALAPDYSTALVGDRNRRYLWVLARSPQLPAAEYEALLQVAAAQGYPVAQLVRTP